jgi:hypothetical protein
MRWRGYQLPMGYKARGYETSLTGDGASRYLA